MSTKIQVRRGTAAQWTAANPVLDEGEFGFETDTGKLKVGNTNGVISQTVVIGGTSVVYTTTTTNGYAIGDSVNVTGITTVQGLPASNPIVITAVSSNTFTAAVTTGTTGTYTSLSGTSNTSWNNLPYVTDTSDFVGILPGAKGGTGVANTGKTITLGGNLTTSGAHTTTLTTSGNTSVALPTSGTLLSTAAVVTGAQGGTGINNSGRVISLGGNLTTSGIFSVSGAFSTALTLTGTTTLTLPTAGTLATLDGSEALTNKTSFNGLSLTNNTTSFTIVGGSITAETLTVNNSYTLTGGDVTVSLAGNLTTAAAFTQSGAFATTLTTTGITNVTLPTTGTLATRAGVEQLTNKTYGSNAYSTTQTLTVANDFVFLTAAVAWTLTLPAPTAGKMLHITRTDATAFIITVSGHINGAAATNNVAWFPASGANRRVILISNGTTWYPMVAGTVV